VVDGAMNGLAFLAYIEQSLAPTLCRRDIAIMHKLPPHKVVGVVEAIEAVGASVLYLPSYSPDFNPIELFFSSSKHCCEKQLGERYRTSGTEFVRSFVQACLQECATFFRKLCINMSGKCSSAR
jgi:transposase